jgi:hypothetical protein
MAREVGTRFSESEFYIDPARVEEYVTALGIAPEQDYHAEVGSVVPPGFFMYVTSYGAEPIHDALDFDMLRTVFGGSEVEHRSPVRVGDRLTVRPWISGVTEKDGKSGHLTFVELTTEYSREDGTIVALERSNTVQRG